MSGICGIWSLGGGDPDVSPFLAQLERRGPDGTHRWSNGPVALGHTLLATTPEALVEVLPLTEPDSGCTITADARLDNREELIEALGLGAETRTIGDGELILRAYLKWGEDCLDHLLGDFAFAIWDARRHQLFCARDHMGMRQLIYHHTPGRLFAFATEAEALVAHPGVPKRINEARIADFLDDLEGIDLTSTFFEEVYRLPPAHRLTVTTAGMSLKRYWELTPGPELKLDSDQAYADAFLDVFTQAVHCRLRCAGPVGSMLSGGLDSSSVAAVAGRLAAASGACPLRTFSAVAPDSVDCIETRSIRSVLSDTRLNGTTVSYGDMGQQSEELAHSIVTLADPFDGQMTLVRAVYLAAHKNGVKVVLDGAGSDLAMTSGNRIAQLMRQGRFGLALAEAHREARFWGVGQRPFALYVAAAWAGLAPRKIRELRRHSISRMEDRAVMEGKAGLTKKFAAQTTFSDRRRQYRRHLNGVSPTGKEYQLRSITHPHTTAARERYDRIASTFTVEPRDPFLDIRMLRFCLSLPRVQLRSDGWTKIVLRRAMTGILPDNVAWRLGKDHLGGVFTRALINHSPAWDSKWAEVSSHLRDRSSWAEPERAINTRRAGDIDQKIFIELFSLACWLSRNDVRNVGSERKEN